MSQSISRRNFLKASSAVGVTAAMIKPSSALAAPKQKTRVVIATDKSCLNSGSPVAAKIQDMVDHAVMTLAGISNKGKAYEALFPKQVTASTKIICKRNDVSGKGNVNTAVVNALKAGFGNMLEGSFNTSNVTVFMRGSSAKSTIQSHDYLVNCPVNWCHGTGYGVTLSLKNTMNYLASPSSYHSKDKKWLHEVSLDSLIKPKQVMSMMDSLIGNCKSGPGSRPNFEAHAIIISKDIVAVDHNTLRIMEKQSGASTSRISTGDRQLTAAKNAKLGTNVPADMEVINIAPPWTTGIELESEPLMKAMNAQVVAHHNRVEFIVPNASSLHAQIAIFDVKGKLVWYAKDIQTNSIWWNYKTSQGSLVPSGMYAYRINTNQALLKGVIMVSR